MKTHSYLPIICGLLTTHSPLFATTVSVDFETNNPFSGGTGVVTGTNGSQALSVGGQNDPAANADFSSSLDFDINETAIQQYAVQFEIGINDSGMGSSNGFRISETGTLNNGTGPNFEFIQGSNGGSFAFGTGVGGNTFTEDINGNSWTISSGANSEIFQTGETFFFDFLVEFSQPTTGNSNDRFFSYSAIITRSDPGNIVDIDTLTFEATKTVNGTNFANNLGNIQFQGSGIGGFEATLDNLILADGAIAVPEPSSIGLISLASIGFLWRRRTQRS